MFNLSPPQLISRSDDARRWGQWRHLFRDQVSTVGIFLGGQPRESRGNTKRGDRDWFLMANKWCAICFTKVVVLFGAASWLVHRQWRQWHANSRAKQLDLKTSVVSIQVFGFLFSKKQFQLERRSMADVKETSSQTIVSCNCRSTHNNWTGAAVNLDHFGLIVCSVAIATSWFLPPLAATCKLQVGRLHVYRWYSLSFIVIIVMRSLLLFPPVSNVHEQNVPRPVQCVLCWLKCQIADLSVQHAN